MILVDANVLMYAAGATHPNKEPSLSFLEQVACGTVSATVDAEMLQEILHRYRAIGRWTDGRAVYDMCRRLFDDVVPIGASIVDRARDLLDHYDGLMARDALHAAVVQVHGFAALCSYDRDFDQITWLQRLTPEQASLPDRDS